MSRNCYDCSLDERCGIQAKGVFSCSEGSPKTREHRLKDLDNEIARLIDKLSIISNEYLLYGALDDSKTIDSAIITLKHGRGQEIL